MAVYMIVLGFRTQAFKNGKRMLRNATLQTTWKRIGIIFGSVSAIILGWFLTRVASAGFSLGKLSVYLGLLILIGIVFGVEITIQRIWPNGERRHRVLGRFTMAIYCVSLSDRKCDICDAVHSLSGKDRIKESGWSADVVTIWCCMK